MQYTVVYESPWDYIFIQTSEGYIITVYFSEYIKVQQWDVFRSFPLTKEEEVQMDSEQKVKEFAYYIRHHYDEFKQREIPKVMP